MSDHAPAGRERRRRGARRPRVTIAVLVSLVVLGAGGYRVAQSGALPQIWDWQRSAYHAPGPAATLTDLTDVDQLAQAFNDHRGVPRLLVLLSPT